MHISKLYTDRTFFKRIIIPALIIMICWTSKTVAQLQVSKLFNNGMVLQREMVISVWGWENAGDTVKVTLNAVSDSTFDDESGRCQVDLPVMDAGDPYAEILYALPQKCHVLLEVFDSTGRRVDTLINEDKSAGNYIYRYHPRQL